MPLSKEEQNTVEFLRMAAAKLRGIAEQAPEVASTLGIDAGDRRPCHQGRYDARSGMIFIPDPAAGPPP